MEQTKSAVAESAEILVSSMTTKVDKKIEEVVAILKEEKAPSSGSAARLAGPLPQPPLPPRRSGRAASVSLAGAAACEPGSHPRSSRAAKQPLTVAIAEQLSADGNVDCHEQIRLVQSLVAIFAEAVSKGVPVERMAEKVALPLLSGLGHEKRAHGLSSRLQTVKSAPNRDSVSGEHGLVSAKPPFWAR